MDVETFIALYRPLIVIAFIVSLINWLGYTVLAPWSKSTIGKIMWTLLLSILLILATPFMQVMVSTVPYRFEYSISAMSFFIIAMGVVGVAIYTTQIKGYLRKRKQRRLERQT